MICHSLYHNYAYHLCFLAVTNWQESHRNWQLLCELLVLFSSCGTLSVGPRIDHEPLPSQTTPSPHNCSITSFIKIILLPHQWQLTPSTNQATSLLKHHIIIKSYFERSPVGFLLKSTGNWPRSWVQDLLWVQVSSSLVKPFFSLTIQSFLLSSKLTTNELAARHSSLTLGQLWMLIERTQPSGTFVCQLPSGGSLASFIACLIVIVIVMLVASFAPTPSLFCFKSFRQCRHVICIVVLIWFLSD